MTITLLAIGKTDNKELDALIRVYEERLKHYVRFELQLLQDVKNVKNLSEALQKDKEAAMILKTIQPTARIILLDEKGPQYTSEDFAAYLQKMMNSGLKQLVFVVGGPYGFSKTLYDKAHGKMSLSKLTFSHQMVRLFMVEQLYRGFTILANEPYHHR